MISTGRAIVALGAAAATLSVAQPGPAAAQCGKASWYSHAGQRTASGEIADPNGLSAAHRSLPFGTKVTVENLKNGRAVTVRINDRGPFVGGRVIDVTRAAADKLGFRNAGVAAVRISVGGKPVASCG